MILFCKNSSFSVLHNSFTSYDTTIFGDVSNHNININTALILQFVKMTMLINVIEGGVTECSSSN